MSEVYTILIFAHKQATSKTRHNKET